MNSQQSQRLIAEGLPKPRGQRSLARALETLALAGRGAFAEVWQVRDPATGQILALKQLRTDCPNPSAGRQLLENEFEIGSRVASPHVVAVHETGLACKPPFLLLEWLSGESLESRLTRVGRLPCDCALWIARQCAQGLSDLLAAGYTHGDIKPSNIFLCGDLAKLIDLGFARPDRQSPLDLSTAPARLLAGTPEYMAPEALAVAGAAGVTRDLYGLGITLYRMLAGRLPFEGETVADVLRQQQQALPPRLRTHAPDVPHEVAQFVHRLLCKQPLRRGNGLQSHVHELVGLELLTLAAESRDFGFTQNRSDTAADSPSCESAAPPRPVDPRSPSSR